MTVIVDMANVVGSRPDGWWRDRVGATARLLQALAPLVGTVVVGPDGAPITLTAIEAVVEGQARAVNAAAAEPVRVVRAERDGDTTIVERATHGAGQASGSAPDGVLVVTADRGLRDRLPTGVAVAGPRWLLDLSGSGHG